MISIVIPARDDDIQIFTKTLESLNNQKVKPKEIILVDSSSNNAVKTAFDEFDLGKIKKIYNRIKLKTYKKKITKKNIESILKEYDIICDGTDNFDTRLLINDYCKKNKKILISAAISKFDGHLLKFNFKKKIKF